MTPEADVKYFKRLSEEPPDAGSTSYFEVGDDFVPRRQLVVGADGTAAAATPQKEPLQEEDFSLTQIEAAEFDAVAGKAK